MSNTVTPISGAGARTWDIATLLFRVPLGIARGIQDGVSVYNGRTVSALVDPGNSVGKIAYNFLKKTFSSLFVNGLEGINTSGVRGALAEVFTKGQLAGLGSKLAAAGPAGLALLGGHFLLAGAAVVLGARLAYGAYKKLDGTAKGWNPDVVNSKTFHGTHALIGAATVIGGIVAISNPVLGLGTIAAGFIGAKVMDAIHYALGGTNWVRYPKRAPFPLNYLFSSFRNPGLEDGFGV